MSAVARPHKKNIRCSNSSSGLTLRDVHRDVLVCMFGYLSITDLCSCQRTSSWIVKLCVQALALVRDLYLSCSLQDYLSLAKAASNHCRRLDELHLHFPDGVENKIFLKHLGKLVHANQSCGYNALECSDDIISTILDNGGVFQDIGTNFLSEELFDRVMTTAGADLIYISVKPSQLPLIPKYCTELEEINCEGPWDTRIVPGTLRHIGESCNTLEVLGFWGLAISGVDLLDLKHCTDLCELYVENLQNGNFLSAIPALSSLHVLDLVYDLEERDCIAIGSCLKDLRELGVSDCVGLRHVLKGCKFLNALKADECAEELFLDLKICAREKVVAEQLAFFFMGISEVDSLAVEFASVIVLVAPNLKGFKTKADSVVLRGLESTFSANFIGRLRL